MCPLLATSSAEFEHADESDLHKCFGSCMLPSAWAYERALASEGRSPAANARHANRREGTTVPGLPQMTRPIAVRITPLP